MMDSPKTASVINLIRSGTGVLRQERHVALPLILCFALVSTLISKLLWPLVKSGNGTNETASILIAEILANIAIYAVATGLIVLWTRCLLIGPEYAFENGWSGFFNRWFRSLSHFLSALLIGGLAILFTVALSALLGHVLFALMGKSAQVLQVPILFALAAVPFLFTITAFWACVIMEAIDKPSTYGDALRFALAQWRQTIPLMAFAVFGSLITSITVFAVFTIGRSFDPHTISGALAVFCSASVEMTFILIIIPALALIMPRSENDRG